MDGGSSEGSEARFAAYVEALGAVLGHADRQAPMRDYCLGLLMPIERKSVEPMAAVTAPGQVAAKHQSLLHFVGNAPWSDAAMLARVGQLVLPASSVAGRSKPGFCDQGAENFAGRSRGRARSRKSVSQWTRRWREMDSNFRFRANSDYAGVGVLRSTWAVLTLRRRDPDWNATKRRRDSERRAQGPFAPRTLLRFIASTDPSAALSSSADFPGLPVIRPTLLR